MADKILYLINPLANENRSLKFWREGAKKHPFLPEDPIDVRSISNLEDFIKDKNPKIIVIAGGDGTINKVCQSIINLPHKPLLAVLPMGFGNALSFCLGTETLAKAVYVIKNQPAKTSIDIMTTNLKDYPIGVFNIGIGFDAKIAYSRVTKKYFGLRSYLASGIRSFFDHKPRQMTFTIDQKVTATSTANAFMIANCPILGKNMVVAPDAKLNDGFLDCTLFTTKMAYLTNIRPKGFKHALFSDLGKVHIRTKTLTVAGNPYVQIDGDPVIVKKGITIGIKPSHISFLRNSLKNIDQKYQPFVT